MEVGCNTYSLRELARHEAFAELRGLDFAAAELWVGHANYLSIGVYMPFHFYRETDVTVRMANGAIQQGTASFSGFLTLLQIKAYLP